MKVLHVIASMGPARGGPSMATRLMARAALAAGIDAHIATTNDNDRELAAVPLEVPHDDNGLRTYFFARTIRPYTVSRGLASWLDTHVGDYDVVHIHSLFSFSTTAAVRAARRRGVPYVLRPLGTLAPYGMSQHPLLKRVSWQLVEKSALKHAASVHFTSSAERAEAARLGDFWRSAVVPLGIDLTEYAMPQRAPGGRLLFMSRIHPKKQLEIVLQALLMAPRATLDVAGDGEPNYVAALRKLADRLGVSDRVRWLGHVAADRKREILRDANVFVLPSINENFGIAVVEALASGLPAIVTRGVAIHREIEDAGAGTVADSTSESVAAAIRALLEPERQQRAALAARQAAEQHFSLQAMSKGLARLYDEAVRAA